MCGNALEEHDIEPTGIPVGCGENVVDNVEREQNIKHRIRKIQRLLSVILVCCLGYLALYQWDSYRQAKEAERLQQIAGVSPEIPAIAADSSGAGADASSPDSSQDTSPLSPERAETIPGADTVQNPDSKTPNGPDDPETAPESALPGYDTLLQINPQIRGWIFIPDSPISFPLLQGEDNDYYLKHDIYGQESRYGSIFVDCDADLYGGAPNLLIYGHHMKSGSMFGPLKEYREEAYYREHPSFFLLLPKEQREYEIVAVLHNDIFSREQEPFQYYDYAHIDSEEMFEEYYNGIKELSLYDTGVTASYGDELVTLCTCDYGGKEQRLLVVGRRR